MRVVIPLDGSQQAEEAIEYTLKHFRPGDVELALVRVLEPRGDDHDSGADEQHARAYLDMLAWQLEDAGYRVKPYVLRGNAATLIAQFAAVINADLVVLTSHGQDRHRSQPIGKTAATVLAQAPCPVLVIPVRDRVNEPRVPMSAPAATGLGNSRSDHPLR